MYVLRLSSLFFKKKPIVEIGWLLIKLRPKKPDLTPNNPHAIRSEVS